MTIRVSPSVLAALKTNEKRYAWTRQRPEPASIIAGIRTKVQRVCCQGVPLDGGAVTLARVYE